MHQRAPAQPAHQRGVARVEGCHPACRLFPLLHPAAFRGGGRHRPAAVCQYIGCGSRHR
ncbi:DUF1472 domain-containing protein [Komagataeibacter xylinus]|uniref:DUF1472 domain-containing protein n=1 Tax=Komagataeibacter xylinus TaxID=28448 RepID=A0A857FRT9_KOMXY|nr:DUF1472 domain-containing protein [Komagataeibacter xylinus]